MGCRQSGSISTQEEYYRLKLLEQNYDGNGQAKYKIKKLKGGIDDSFEGDGILINPNYTKV